VVDGYGPGSRGLVLAAQGERLSWYVDGQPLAESNGQIIWRPAGSGFYRVAVVDGRGRQAVARVRVR
jgi:penicillin-binding protein 1C